MVLKYRKGKLHANANALSRPPQAGTCEFYSADVHLADLSCGGCKHCKRADQQWSAFTRDVDWYI